jgi:hypothetical protein
MFHFNIIPPSTSRSYRWSLPFFFGIYSVNETYEQKVLQEVKQVTEIIWTRLNTEHSSQISLNGPIWRLVKALKINISAENENG